MQNSCYLETQHNIDEKRILIHSAANTSRPENDNYLILLSLSLKNHVYWNRKNI
jgi:hypothetical protein